MATFLLVIIYLAFISLGLPDSLLGVAWPVTHMEIGAPLGAAGLISMVIAGGTIVSSLSSGRILKWLGTGKVTAISCFMTAASLLGFSAAPSLAWIILLAVPLGLGAGSVDAGLNNYVATHYKARHMSWLHCCWGIGATLGPILMSRSIANQNSWRNGYSTVAVIQFVLTVLFFITLPLWSRVEKEENHPDVDLDKEDEALKIVVPQEALEKARPIQIKGVKLAMLSFLFYCAAESTMGLWGSSFLVQVKELPAATAAGWVSTYYAGITAGRLITGFITLKVSNHILIRMGQSVALVGVVLLLLPLPTICSLAGFIMFGLGCAPIYPCMAHETPTRFGKEHSQTIMGYQMAFAYTGSTFFPPLFGWVASRTTMGIFPFFVLVYIMAMMVGSKKIHVLMKARDIIPSGKELD